MAETSVTLAGNLTDDPQLRHTSSGTAKATFRLAVTGRVRDGDTWKDAEPSFFTVVCGASRPSMLLRRWAKVLGSWWRAGWCSGRGRPATAAPGR